MKPSTFKIHPWNSVFKNSESETIARNVMNILARTGDEWRVLTWEEYKKERLKDGYFTESEKGYLDKIAPYCLNAQTAALFSPSWAELAAAATPSPLPETGTKVMTRNGEVLPMNEAETEVFHFGTWKEIREDEEGGLYIMGGLTIYGVCDPEDKENYDKDLSQKVLRGETGSDVTKLKAELEASKEREGKLREALEVAHTNIKNQSVFLSDGEWQKINEALNQ